MVAFGGSRFYQASDKTDMMAIGYLALTVWAYGELVYGASWFRRLLGLSYIAIATIAIVRLLNM